jgi:RNA-directed DNA polymerase
MTSTVPNGARQGEEIPVIAGMETSIWTERRVSALVNGVKGGKWFSLMDKVSAAKTLALAWGKVQANKGVAGVDKQSVERFAFKSEIYLRELHEALSQGRYRPQAIRRVDIPKGEGQTRPLGIPTVKDRIVQTAVKLVIEPIFEVQFLATSYGFRPDRGCKDALREVDELLKQDFVYVVDADLKGYFDSIPHDKLMQRVEDSISDGRVLELIKGWLKQDIVKGVERWTPTGGTPQGAVITP